MEADLIYWWIFLTSMEAVRGQTPYSDHTLWHFNSMFGPSHSAKVCGGCMVFVLWQPPRRSKIMPMSDPKSFEQIHWSFLGCMAWPWCCVFQYSTTTSLIDKIGIILCTNFMFFHFQSTKSCLVWLYTPGLTWMHLSWQKCQPPRRINNSCSL